MKKNRAQKSVSGTSLIELLVVIVVFLIGILTIAQIFPGGLRILATTRAESMATTEAHAMMDYMRANADQTPEQIVPITYTASGGALTASSTPVDMSEDNLGPEGASIMPSTSSRPASWGFTSNTWDVFDGSGNDMGPWQFLSGPNNVRHVIGEGKAVPAPRTTGANYGCLMTLLFGPIMQGYSNLVLYGNDLQKTEGPPSGNLASNTSGSVTTNYLIPGRPVATYEYYLDDTTSVSDPVLYIPEDGFQTTNVGHNYRISVTAYYTSTSGIQQWSTVMTLAVPATPSSFGGAPESIPTGYGAYAIYHLNAAGLLNLGSSLVSVNYGSLRIEREYDPVSQSNPMDASYNPDGTPHNPYQYEMLNPELGQVLINPLAYGYVEESQNGMPIRLVAKADYDVLDWRVLHEDFRLPDASPYAYQLHINNIKHVNGYEADLTYTAGIGTGLSGSTSGAAVIVVDQTTGGIFTTSSYSVDYHLGLITFKPSPSSWSEVVNTVATTGANTGLVTGTATINPIPNISNLNLRVYYMANGEWACQLLKSATNYYQTVSLSPALYPGEFYVVQPASGTTNGSTAIQFCKADIGQTISFDEIWYQNGSGTPICARGQSAVVKVISGVPVVTITDIDPQATTLDFSNGYAVKGVKGLSSTVRVLWNPNTVKFQSSGSNNLSSFNTYLAGWRSTSTEAVLDKGMVQK